MGERPENVGFWGPWLRQLVFYMVGKGLHLGVEKTAAEGQPMDKIHEGSGGIKSYRICER